MSSLALGDFAEAASDANWHAPGIQRDTVVELAIGAASEQRTDQHQGICAMHTALVRQHSDLFCVPLPGLKTGWNSTVGNRQFRTEQLYRRLLYSCMPWSKPRKTQSKISVISEIRFVHPCHNIPFKQKVIGKFT